MGQKYMHVCIYVYDVYVYVFEEIMAENFPRSSTNPKMINTKRTTPRHTLIKFLKTKDKENIFKAASGKKKHYIQQYEKMTDLS